MSDELIGPVTLEAKVYFRDAEGTVTGSAVVGFAPGKAVTREAIHRAVGQVLAAIPDDCELLDGDDFFNRVLVKEKTGRVGNFATPRQFQYDVAALVELGRAAYQPEPESDEDDPDEGEDFDLEDDE